MCSEKKTPFPSLFFKMHTRHRYLDKTYTIVLFFFFFGSFYKCNICITKKKKKKMMQQLNKEATMETQEDFSV